VRYGAHRGTRPHVEALRQPSGAGVRRRRAGQGAAEKFYEWEQKYQVQVSVAAFPKGKDPGELSQSDPQALAAAVDTALPFLGFRLQRVMTGRR
jgi:hypothetical protein